MLTVENLSGNSPLAVGARLRLTRLIKGWAPAYAAQLVGESRQNWSNWEGASGGRYIPVPALMRFCAVAGVSADWILRGDPSGLKGEMFTRVSAALAGDLPPEPPKRRRATNAA